MVHVTWFPDIFFSFVEYAVTVVDTIYCYMVQSGVDVCMPTCTAYTAVCTPVADVQTPQFL
jgi:hypothetical protein